MARALALKIQKWGNSLAVRLPAPIVRAARLSVGQPVAVSAEEFGVAVRLLGKPTLTLAQKLALFDESKHGGELMKSAPIGREVF